MRYISLFLTPDTHQGRSLSSAEDESEALGYALLAAFIILVFPILILLTSEAQNITFRLIARKCESQSSCAAILAYLLTNSLISAVAGALGFGIYILYHTLNAKLAFISVGLIVAISILMLIPTRLLWKRKLVESEYMLMDRSLSLCENFGRSICEIMKLQHIEVTQKLVFLLSSYVPALVIIVEAIIVYVILAIVAALVKGSIEDDRVQRIIQIVGGILCLIYVAPSIILIL
jgi:ABC-type multidrug transport system permease subunit